MSVPEPSVAAALSRVRRGEGDGGARRAFTVARTEAVLKLRELPRPGPWSWTLPLLRAANAVSPAAQAAVGERDEDDARVITVRCVAPRGELGGVDLRGLVLAAAEGDSDMSEEAGVRWRRLVGAAVNGALAGRPTAVEVRTSGGAVRYVRKDSPGAGQDPYGEQRAPGRAEAGTFEVEVRSPRPGFGRRLAGWLARQPRAEEALTELWRSALFGADPGQTAGQGIDLGRAPPGTPVLLGRHAVWGPAPVAGPWLVRDGVRLVSLAPALTRAGLDPAEFAGWVECAALRPTADETSVALDAGFELLVAWLLDARAHATPVSAAPGFWVTWPDALSHVPTVSGTPVSLEQVAQRCRMGRDLLYVWPHLAREVPSAIRARVHALWPSELALVLAAIPEARAVPARALGDSPQFDRADLSNLTRGSLPPVDIDLGEDAAVTLPSGVRARVHVQAFIHRYASAEVGAIALLAHARRVAHVREPARVLAGVTLIAELVGDPPEALAIDALRGEKGLLQAVAERCRAAAAREIGRILAQALTHSSPWELPLVRAQAAGLTGATLGVRYRARREDGALELSWDDSPLLGLPVGHDMAGAAVTLQQALVRCRDVGGIVVEDPRQRWTTFRSSDRRHEPWALDAEGRALIERALGEDVLWDMPTVAEAHVLPAPAGEQRRLVLGAGAIEQLLAKRTPRARADLRGHVLVAEALGGPTAEVVDAPIFVRYDPRALEPLRGVSRADARAEGLGLAPPGSASRALAGPVLLATPGEARLLHAAGHAPAAVSAASAAGPRAARAPVRRSGAGEAALCVLPVADELALGALRLEAHPAKIAVWGGGLHIDDIGMPAPLEQIGGRLSLTRQGTRAGSDRLAAQVKGQARALARRALAERLLHPPGSPQRVGLDAFRERCRAEGSPVRDILRDETGPEDHALGAICSQSLAKHPPRRLGGPRRLEALLRQVLTRPLAVESALLSWQVARLTEAEGKAWTISLGRRSAEVQRALAPEVSQSDLFAAAALVVAQVFPEARGRGGAGAAAGLVDELVADYRLLALLYAHLP